MQQGNRGLWLELAFWLAVGIGAFALTYEFDDPIQGYRFGATAWPRAIILAMVAIAIIQFLMSMRRSVATNAGAPAPSLRSRLEGLDRTAVVKVGLAFGLPLLYVLALRRTGFYLTTPVFLMTYLVLLGERRWTRVLLVTAIIYALMIVVFTTIFYVPLPVGNWPAFYDINNWLLESYRWS